MKLKRSARSQPAFILLAGFLLLYIHLQATPKYSAWSAPANLGPVD